MKQYYVQFKSGIRTPIIEASTPQEAEMIAAEDFGENGKAFEQVVVSSKEKAEQVAKQRSEAKDIAKQRGITTEEETKAFGEEHPIVSSLASYISPDAYKETMEGKAPGFGTLKSFGKGALTIGSLVAGGALTKGLSMAGRILTGGDIGLANYLGNKAIDTTTPTLSGAAIGAAEGAVGQGLVEGGAQLFKVGFGVGEKYMGSLPFTTKTMVYNRIQKIIDSAIKSKDPITLTPEDILNGAKQSIDDAKGFSNKEKEAIKSKIIDWVDDEQVLSNIDEINQRIKVLKGGSKFDEPSSYGINTPSQQRAFTRQGIERASNIGDIRSLQAEQSKVTSPGFDITAPEKLPGWLSPALSKTGKFVRTTTPLTDYLTEKNK